MPPENDNVDYRRMEGWLDSQAMQDRHSGGGPPRDGGSDGLIRRVEAVEADLKELKSDIKGLVKDVAEIKGRLTSMPTTFQTLTWFVGIAFALTGLVFAVARTVGTH